MNTDPREALGSVFVVKLKANGGKETMHPCDLPSKHPAESNHFKIPANSRIKITEWLPSQGSMREAIRRNNSKDPENKKEKTSHHSVLAPISAQENVTKISLKLIKLFPEYETF